MTASARPFRMPRLDTLRGYLGFARIALRASPVLSVVTLVATLAAAVAPLVGAVAIGSVVGKAPDVVRDGFDSPAGTAAVHAAVVVGILFAVQWAAMALRTTAATTLAERVDFSLQRGLMDAVTAPVGIAHLEDPATVDLVNTGQDTFRAWLRPGRLAIGLSSLVSSRLLLAGACVLLAFYRWPLALGLLVAALWAEQEDQRANRRAAEHHHGGSPLARRTQYYYDLGVTPAAAKEIRVFGLPSFLMERFEDTWRRAMGEALGAGSRRALVAAGALGALSLLGIGWLCLDAASGRLEIGSTAIYATAFLMGVSGVAASGKARLDSEMALATLRRYERAVAAVAPAADSGPVGQRPADGLPRQEIRFSDVRFRYPGTGADALDGLDLVIPAGRSLAVVGANGAGKTTLVKLLCALYRPTAGRITVDGTDLAELDPASWRRRTAAVFQDWVQYELSAAANVGLGAVHAQDDRDGIRAAAAEAGVADVVGRLRKGWDTVLSADYADGVDLSGGEWQKIALARGLFAVRHGAGVLILDEPAANLDARAEARLYERFLSLTEGVTTVVISHRFSTVRQASSIAVIDGGRVVEQGSHDELVALGGRYEEMFRLQASRFTPVDDPAADPADDPADAAGPEVERSVRS